MDQELVRHRAWSGNLFRILSILVVCVGVPMVFILGGSFSAWLGTVGVHATPNFSGGTLIAHFVKFDRQILDPRPNGDMGEVASALAIREFSVRKVAFRPFSGIGIASRLNLVFDFDGKLPDPQNSSEKFSATTIHIYIKVPGKVPERVLSDKVARVDFAGEQWNYQVIIDGFHDQARVFDVRGNLVARGLGLYVEYSYEPAPVGGSLSDRRIAHTTLTAAIPTGFIGDPATGDWIYYVLVGTADSRNASMMLHSGRDGGLGAFSRAMPADSEQPFVAGGRLRLLPLPVSNHY